MFVNEDYLNYNKVVSVSDNYVVLSKTSIVNADWQNPRTIDVIIQYFKPSFLTIEDTRTYTSNQQFNSISVDDNFYSRSDCLDIIVVQFLVIFFVIFCLNGLTRFVKKGGIFFGN